jgi:hypothetical protein
LGPRFASGGRRIGCVQQMCSRIFCERVEPAREVGVVAREKVAVHGIEHPAVFPAAALHELELWPVGLDQPRDVSVSEVVHGERLEPNDDLVRIAPASFEFVSVPA